MARLICQVIFKPGRVTIVWSEGTQVFAPYHLDGDEVRRLDDTARTARHRLTQAIHGGEDPSALRDLAGLGHQLYRLVFHVDANDPAARSVQEWWQSRARDVSSLDILTNHPGRVPWNLVHDATASEGGLEGFWGQRFPLGVGRRVTPLLGLATLTDPTSFLLLDSRDAETRDLFSWSQERQLPVAGSTNEFLDSLGERAADLLTLTGRIAEGRLHWKDQSLRLDEAFEKAAHPERGNPLALYLLAVHGEVGQVDHWECFVGATAMNTAGAVMPEVPLSAALALAMARSFLPVFLGGNIELGEALRQARRQVGLAGLAWSAFAPAGLGVNTSGDNSYIAIPKHPLPELPYSPLQALDPERRAFLAGRQADLLRFAQTLDEPATRGLLLHGGPATGKTSFLQAGVLPFLEQEAIGFQGLRIRAGENEEPSSPIMLRTGPDILGQICQGLAYFCASPLEYATPAGSTVRLDLPAYLADVRTENPTSTAFQAGVPIATAVSASPERKTPSAEVPAASPDEWAAELYRLAKEDPDRWLRVVDEITRSLPAELVLVFEQAEDLLKTQTETSLARRRLGLELLARLASSSARCRIIISIRTDSLGELLSALPAGKERGAFREFFLPPLSDSTLEEILLLPTATEPLPYGEGSPHARYNFFIEEGFAPALVREVRRISAEAQLSPLPLLHVIATELHRQTLARQGDLTIRPPMLRRLEPLQDLPAKLVDRTLMADGLNHRDVQHLLDSLVRYQPGGSVGRELVSLRSLASTLPGSAADLENRLDRLSQTSPPLIDMQAFLPGGQAEPFVSLANDSVAQTRARNRELKSMRSYARTKVVDTLWIMIPLAALAAALAFFLTRRYDNRTSKERFEKEAEVLLKQLEQERLKEARNTSLIVNSLQDQTNWALYQANLAEASRALELGDLVKARGHLISTLPMPTDKKGETLRRDHRGFEWFHLWRRLHPERYTLQGHIAPVSAAVFSPDEKWIATASLDGTIKLWDREKLREIDTIPGEKVAVHAIAFFPDGTRLAVARADKKALAYDIKSGKEETRFVERPTELAKGLDGAAIAIASQKDRPLAVADNKGNLAIFNAKGEQTTLALNHDTLALAHGPDNLLFVAGAGGKVIGIDPAKGKEPILTIDTPLARIDALAWSPEQGLLAMGGARQKDGSGPGLLLLADKAGKTVGSPQELAASVRCLTWLKGKNALAIGTRQHALQIWDREKGGGLRSLPSHFGWINAIAAGSDGMVLSAGQDAQVKVWSLRPDFEPTSLPPLDAAVRLLVFTPDGKAIVSADAQGALRISSVATGKTLTSKDKIDMEPQAIAFHVGKEQTRIAVAWAGKENGRVLIADLHQGDKGIEWKNETSLSDLAGVPQSIVLSSDGKSAFVGLRGGKIQHFSLTKEKTIEFGALKEDITALAMGAQDQVLLVGTESGSVVVFETATGKKLTSGKKHEGAVRTIVDASREGKSQTRFLTWADDRMIIGWEGKTDTIATFVRHHAGNAATPSTMAKSPRSFLTVTGYGDRGVQLFDDEMRSRTVLEGQQSPVRRVAVSPDESVIAAGSDDGSIRLWRAATPAELKNPQPR